MQWNRVTKGFFNKFAFEIKRHDIEVRPVMNLLKPIIDWEKKNNSDPLAKLPSPGSTEAGKYIDILKKVHGVNQKLSIIEDGPIFHGKGEVLRGLQLQLEAYEELFKSKVLHLERKGK